MSSHLASVVDGARREPVICVDDTTLRDREQTAGVACSNHDEIGPAAAAGEMIDPREFD